VGAVEGGPSIDDFIDAWKVKSKIVLEGLVFFEEFTSVKEVKVFEAGFSGDVTLLTGQGILDVEDTVLSTFNDLADQVCDPLICSLWKVEVIEKIPSQAPSISFMPSISAQPGQPPSIGSWFEHIWVVGTCFATDTIKPMAMSKDFRRRR
jgi:hypothetical protein